MDRGVGTSDEKTMTVPEIEKSAADAGFELTEATNPDRLIFTRGVHTLIVNADATWICHTDAGSRRTSRNGYTVRSLFDFLSEFPKLERRAAR